MRRITLLVTAVTLLVAGAASAQQGSDPYQGDRKFRDRANFDLGFVMAGFDSTASFDRAGQPGTSIDLEEDLDIDSDTNDFFLRGYYRFKPKHRMEATYYALRREGEKVIDRTINWGDLTWNANATVKADSKASFGRIGYAWSFLKKDKGEIALHGDLAYIETGVSIEGTTDTGVYGKEDGSAGFPYPTIGLSAMGYLGKRTVIEGRIDWMGGFEFSGVSGDLLAGEVGVRCYVAKHFGLGVHWLLWELDAQKTKDNNDLEVDWGWDGLTGTFSFVW